jgi:hypothetical protein
MSGTVIANDGRIPGTTPATTEFVPLIVNDAGSQDEPEMAFVWSLDLPAGYTVTPPGTDAWAANPLILNAPGGGYWVRWWPLREFIPPASAMRPAPVSCAVEFYAQEMWPMAPANWPYAADATRPQPGHGPCQWADGTGALLNQDSWYFPLRVSWGSAPPPRAQTVNADSTGLVAITLTGYEYGYGHSNNNQHTTKVGSAAANVNVSAWKNTPIEPTHRPKAATAPATAKYRGLDPAWSSAIGAVRAVYSDGTRSAWTISPAAVAPLALPPVIQARSIGVFFTGNGGKGTSWINPGTAPGIATQATEFHIGSNGFQQPTVIGRDSGPIGLIRYRSMTFTYPQRVPAGYPGAGSFTPGYDMGPSGQAGIDLWQAIYQWLTAAIVSAAPHNGGMGAYQIAYGSALAFIPPTSAALSSSTLYNPFPTVVGTGIGSWNAWAEEGHNFGDSNYLYSSLYPAALLQPNGDLIVSRFANSRGGQGNWGQLGAAAGKTCVEVEVFGYYGDSAKYLVMTDAYGAAGSSSQAGAGTAAPTYTPSGTKVASGAGVGVGILRAGPASGVRDVVGSPDGGRIDANASQRFAACEILCGSSPNLGPTSPTRQWCVQAWNGAAWVVIAFFPDGGLVRADFPLQPPGSILRVMPWGPGWRSNVSSSGPLGVLSAVNWIAGG